MSYAFTNMKHIILKNNYTDFNNKKIINQKKRLLFKKYYIYQNNSVVQVDNRHNKNIEILEVHESFVQYENTVCVIYIDPNGKLSFIIIKNHHPKLSKEQVIEKAESTPPQRITTFSLFNKFYILGVIRFKYDNMKKINIALGYDKSLEYSFTYIFPKSWRKRLSETTNKFSLFIHSGFIKINKKDLLHKYEESSEINLPVYIKSTNKEDLNYYYPLKFSHRLRYNKKNYIYSSTSYRLNSAIEFFVRKSISGQIVLVMTDYLNIIIKLKEKMAKLASKLGSQEKYDIYFEKFSKNAGESAFELFKKSKAENDPFSKFILDKYHPDFSLLQNQFGKENILAHNSFKSLYHIFKARRFISSDLVNHIQRRLYDNSQLIKQKILNNNGKIFLQHGVSLATNVFERGYFNRKVPIAPDYIVTSSNLESSYFKKYAHYERNRLIESGIPNLDLYVENKFKAKEDITFMLTWRPWDITGKIENNSYIDRYFQFIDLITSDPFYKDKTINIILHPKAKLMIENQFPKTYEKIKNFLYEKNIKDALINSKVLITDYSSICFYAFAGGSNIIYFWGDKEIAEHEYGASNILQNNNRFGDVVYDVTHSLSKSIKRNYNHKQDTIYSIRYNKMVEHTYGNNTENVYKKIKSL